MNYALITGASKGIGKAIAILLAQKGHAVLLVARSEQLLRDLSVEINQQYNVETAYLAVDLSDSSAPQQILDWCNSNNYSVNMLINNAGYGLNGLLEEYPLEAHLEMMQVNMNSLLALTYLFLPYLKKLPKAYIGNIASGAAYQSVPGLNTYAATKSFVLSFSRGLAYELRNSTVSVSCVCPGATDTDFANRAHVTNAKALKMAEKFNMSPSIVAQIAVEGILAGKVEIVPGFINKMAKVLANLLPDRLLEKSAADIYGI
jgi:short-subunit dehydrogenase